MTIVNTLTQNLLGRNAKGFCLMFLQCLQLFLVVNNVIFIVLHVKHFLEFLKLRRNALIHIFC